MRTAVVGVQRLFGGLSRSISTRATVVQPTSSGVLALSPQSHVLLPSLSLSSSMSSSLWSISSLSLIRRSYMTIASTNFPVWSQQPLVLQARSFSTKKKNSNNNSSKNKKKKNSSSSSNKNKSVTSGGVDDTASVQHQGWVDFQKSIAVEGFETGQTTDVVRHSKRGGKRLSKQKSKQSVELEERMAERQRMTDIGGGEYPPLRYSDAETERLLAQAYAALPARTGKRGTRNLKRQNRRWFLVREIRKKYKRHMLRFQERKMAERSRRVKAVKSVLAEAPETCEKDRAYQWQVFQRWAATMNMNRD